MRALLTLAALLCAVAFSASPAAAKAPILPQQPSEQRPSIPPDLTPDTVDALLARLTDGEIRGLLRDELARRAQERIDGAASQRPLRERLAEQFEKTRVAVENRAGFMVQNISALFDDLLSKGRPRGLTQRLNLAKNSLIVSLLGFFAIIGGAFASAYAVNLVSQNARRWLRTTAGESFWDRAIRAFALGVVEFAQPVAFVLAINAMTPLFRGSLGPFQGSGIDYVWILSAGVFAGWSVIILSRRVFAPYAPQLRLAYIDDSDALALDSLVQRSVLVGVGGWLIGGLAPTFGLGFGLAIATVALSGVGVYLLLSFAILQGAPRIRLLVTQALSQKEALHSSPTSLTTVLSALTPWLMFLYLSFAFVYWLVRWFETGQPHIAGPIGALLVLMSLSALDRVGLELSNAIVGRFANAERFASVIHGAWRVVLAIGAALAVGAMWGIDLLGFVKGDAAPAWASAFFDVVITLLIGVLVWRLIQAALFQERKVSSSDQEDLSDEVGQASRFDTLVPLFRNLLLISLSVVVIMIVLSSLGVDIGPLLASAGIIGIAIGFGAQTLVRDIFSGMFFLIDDAFRVGEYIEIDTEIRDEVEALSIRSLQLRHHRGSVITIPFGELKSVINHNRDWVIYKMSFRLEPETDPAVVKKIVKRIGAELLADPIHGPKFLEPLKSQGVFQIDADSALIMRVKFTSKPRMQFILRREVYHRIRAAFAEAGVKFARNKVEVVATEGDTASAGAAASAASQANENAIKNAGDAQ